MNAMHVIIILNIVNLILVYNQLQILYRIYKSTKRPIKRPGKVTLKFYEGENGMLKFVLTLPKKSAADVVSRVLTVTIGEEMQVFELAADAVETQEFECADNTKVFGTLADVDDAGNVSEPREFAFEVVDTIVPPMPGELGVKVTGESEADAQDDLN
jgi:hypothetical protein